MTLSTITAINPWALALGVLAAFLISFVWYAQLFQKPWLRALGISAADLEDMQLGKGAPYAVAGISYAVLGFVLALFVGWLDLRSPVEGALLGILTFSGFNITAFVRLVFFEDRPVPLVLIDGGADLITHLVFAVLLATWR